jgi:uncharacterized protein (TIGR02646 family)
MRSISKPWPPKNVSPDGQKQCTMQQAERDFQAALRAKNDEERAEYARTQFDSLDKRKLRDVLYQEQRKICVYCERRIEEMSPVPRIDHWCPIHENPELALHWTNLYLSCPTADTCDIAKHDFRLVWDDEDPDLPWPTEAPYENWIGFTSGGEAYVRTDSPLDEAGRKALELAIADRYDGGRTRKSILNLNHPALVAARKAEIDRERTHLNNNFLDQTATAEERRSLAAALLAKNPYSQFVSIRAAWLRKTLGKHR